MNSLLNMLLRFGISAGIQDREAFIEKVSTLIQEKMGTDEEQAQNIGEKILLALDTAKDQLVIEQLLSGIASQNKKLEEEISALSKTILEVKRKLDKED